MTACPLVLLIDPKVSQGLGRHASETPLFVKYLMRAYYMWDNELQVQKCCLHSEIWSFGREGGCLTSARKSSMMIVAVLSVMAHSAGEGGRKGSWREECVVSLSPTLITLLYLNYLFTRNYWLSKSELQPICAFFSL